MPDIIYLVRHAAPPVALQRRYWGQSDPGLAPGSLDGIPALAALCRPRPDILFSSPLPRALATAERLGDELSLVPQVEPGLAEAAFGDFEGLSYPEVAERFPDAAAAWVAQGDDFTFPGGESVRGFLARAERAFRLCLGRQEKTVLCVTHGGVIAAWRCLFLGEAYDRRFSRKADYAALTAFRRRSDGQGWEVTEDNATG